jgi:hypothetical protein
MWTILDPVHDGVVIRASLNLHMTFIIHAIFNSFLIYYCDMQINICANEDLIAFWGRSMASKNLRYNGRKSNQNRIIRSNIKKELKIA